MENSELIVFLNWGKRSEIGEAKATELHSSEEQGTTQKQNYKTLHSSTFESLT